MIDKDEYPQTAELERRCVAMLADLWNAPDPGGRGGLFDDRFQRGVHARRDGAQAALGAARTPDRLSGGRPAEPGDGRQRPGLLGEVLQLLGGRGRVRCRWRATGSTSTRRRAAELCDENTIGVVGILGSTFDGSATSRSRRSARPWTSSRSAPASTSRCTSTARPARWSRRSSTRTWCGTSGCRGCRRSTPRGTSTGWSTRASAGRCGATAAELPEELVFRVNYLGGDMPTFALNFSRPGAQVVAQYYTLPAAGPRGLPGRAAGLPGRGAPARRADRGAGRLPADHPGRRAAGVRLHHRARRDGVRRLRRLPAAARAAAGWCPRTPSRRTARTCRCCGWCAATGSPPTWPTCSGGPGASAARTAPASRAR